MQFSRALLYVFIGVKTINSDMAELIDGETFWDRGLLFVVHIFGSTGSLCGFNKLKNLYVY